MALVSPSLGRYTFPAFHPASSFELK